MVHGILPNLTLATACLLYSSDSQFFQKSYDCRMNPKPWAVTAYMLLAAPLFYSDTFKSWSLDLAVHFRINEYRAAF